MAVLYFINTKSWFSYLLAFSLLQFLVIAQNAQNATTPKCYFHDGTEDANSAPCLPQGAKHSPCCRRAHPKGDYVADTCLANGLCLAPHGSIYQNACTDQTWESKDCPSVCPNKHSGWKDNPLWKDWEPPEGKWHEWDVQACSLDSICCQRKMKPGTCGINPLCCNVPAQIIKSYHIQANVTEAAKCLG